VDAALAQIQTYNAANPSAPLGAKLRVYADVQVRVEIGTDVEYVRALVDALRLRC
jgi:hypothetical protein